VGSANKGDFRDAFSWRLLDASRSRAFSWCHISIQRHFLGTNAASEDENERTNENPLFLLA
jgi:hypothetical protein